jgi:hypothetical protein
LPAIEPLFLVPGTRNYVRADTSGNIRFNAGQTVMLACTGTTLTVTGGAEATATCVGGVQFSIGGTNYNANQLGCARVCIASYFLFPHPRLFIYHFNLVANT